MSEIPAEPPPKRSAESSGAQNICRGVSVSDISAPMAQPSFGAAPWTTIDSTPASISLQQCIRDDQPLDLRSPLVDLGDARVAKVPLHAQLLRVSHAAVNLYRLVRDS